MKKKLICILVISIIVFNGCFSYSDLNKALFVTSVIVDIDQDKRVILYLECFLPFRSSSKASTKGQRIVFKGKGKTVYEAMKDLNLSSSYKLNYTQNKAIIFTKKSAEYGLDNFIDTFQRQQEFLIRPYILMFMGDPEDLIKMNLKEEEYIGVFLKNLIDNQKSSSRTVQIHLNDFLNKRTMGSKTNIITTVDISKEQIEPKLQVDGGTIIKDDKLAGILKKQDGEKYNFLMNKVREGTLESQNPSYKDKFISLNISKSKTYTSINYDGKKVYLRKRIKTHAAIADIQKGLTVNQSNLSELRGNTENNIKKLCTDFFNQYKQDHIDIFDIQEEFHRKYPKENIKNIVDITELDLTVNVIIDDTLNIFDFR